MFKTILLKELRGFLVSPKFITTFAAASLLILLSIQAGITDYTTAVRRTEAAKALAVQKMAHASSWQNVSMTAFRQPDPLQVFVVGTANDIGRFSPIDSRESVNLQNSVYSDDPLFALFRSADFCFIVTVVLSLFAILFTYDAVNGERQEGTLALTFSNPISRVQYLVAKFVGAGIGLSVPLALAVLIGVLLVVLEGVPFLPADWVRLMVLCALSLLVFLFFLVLGILVSSSTRSPGVSFLVCLAAWIVLVLIVPKVGMMAATIAVPVPSYAEIEGQRDAYAKDQWEASNAQATARWDLRERAMTGMSEEGRQAYRDAHRSQWENEDDASRKGIAATIEVRWKKLAEEWRQRKAGQERLGNIFALFSPASAYQLAAMTLAGTDAGLKARYENSMQEYRDAFVAFTERRQKEEGGGQGMRMTFDSNRGFTFSAPRSRGTLDLSDMPRYSPPLLGIRALYADLIAPAALILSLTLFAFAGAMAAFLRYDVR